MKTGNGLLAKLRRQNDVRRSLERLQPLMLPGNYHISGGLALAPAGPTGQPDDYQRGLQEAGTDHFPWLLHRLVGRPYKIAPPAGAATPLYDTLIQRRDWVILVAAGRDHVLRLTSRPELVARLTRNAEWLRRSYPVPWIEEARLDLEGLYGVREDFVAGCPIRAAVPRQWDPVFRQLLSVCQKHAAWCEGRFGFAPVMAELSRWQIPPWLARAFSEHQTGLQELLADCPLLAGHGDCHNGNVVVQPDGSLILIDLERVQPLPFFFDALSLLRGSGEVNAVLRQAYLAGDYDAELAAIWAVAGRKWQARWRVPALLAMVVAHAFRPQFSSSSSARRREKLIGAAEKIRHDCKMG
ncbi:phosphotransferase [Desulfurivibrio alkaliphilus]|uniref:Aminoglycoside phosphotransferase n=1 Tax=Desulfurivibrio alkaliphilus (strain DSM 19089 / UNIQEM U267 / AHT2) TaxID=589865 RepID=D6Z2L3_DESAT|nr:phosphotransferase [Desulfurivibrio alkaliphilus]ADH85788.1 aminoglycoside phosphotransferase [Desulfurivibrio alkaliphilus AHT 2]